MKCRKLFIQDAVFMYKWMQNREITQFLNDNYSAKTMKDAEDFITNSYTQNDYLHLAIVNEEDIYMGTVSLKSIDFENKNAEFAIVVCEEALHSGYAWFGMLSMLEIAFKEYGLLSVYWRVKKENRRAIRFFEKHGFFQLVDIPQSILERHSKEEESIWYACLSGRDYKNVMLTRGSVAGCQIKRISTTPTIGAGELSVFEAARDVPFDIKRIYYISKVPEGQRRGFHAHKELKQLLFCPYGEIQLILDDGEKREEITLNDPSVGILIEKPIWREMLWMVSDSVLCVAASEYYDTNDYIRNYEEFLKYQMQD